MSSFSDYTENGVLNYLFNGTPFSIINRFFGLFTSANGLENNQITDAEEISNVSTGYTRINLDSLGGFTSSTAGTISNAQEMDFPIAQSDWGTITHSAILDSLDNSTGNVIAWGPLLNPRVIYTGDSIKVPVGALTITLQ